MGWSDSPLTSITIPADHGPTDPYIYVGTGDPLAAKSSENAAIVAHYGSHNSGFVYGVRDLGSDRGSISLTTASDLTGGTFHTVFQAQFDPLSNALTPNWGEQAVGCNSTVYGDQVSLSALSDVVLSCGAANHVRVFQDGSLIDNHSHQYLRGEANSTLVSFTSLTSSTVAVTFAHQFTNTPKVMTNINNGAGATAQWHSRAINITTTGFTLFVFSTASSTWSNVEVQWIAQEPAS